MWIELFLCLLLAHLVADFGLLLSIFIAVLVGLGVMMAHKI